MTVTTNRAVVFYPISVDSEITSKLRCNLVLIKINGTGFSCLDWNGDDRQSQLYQWSQG